MSLLSSLNKLFESILCHRILSDVIKTQIFALNSLDLEKFYQVHMLFRSLFVKTREILDEVKSVQAIF